MNTAKSRGKAVQDDILDYMTKVFYSESEKTKNRIEAAKVIIDLARSSIAEKKG